MNPLATVAQRWYRHCFQLVRSEGFYNNGVYKRLAPQISWQRGNIQPEGTRSDGAVTVFSAAFMRVAASPNQLADRIMYKGTEYEVSSAEYWESHNRYVCAKVGQ